ncbi:MAG: 2-phosphosulfolactate phosphatase [Eubacteriales bacterium]
MQITVAITSKYFKSGELTDKTAVVVDVLRASSTIITAIQHECDRIIPAASPMEAAKIKKASEGEVLLGGEMESKIIQGFDKGNSPLEYMDQSVLDKTIIFSTADGSITIKKCDEAAEVLIGAMLNAAAVAKRVIDIGRDTYLVCAGTQGKFSTDDVLAAGCILDRIMQLDASVELDDLGKVAIKMYLHAKSNMISAMEGCRQYEYLAETGHQGDVKFCLQEDIYPIVPVYKEGVIVK